MPADYMLALNDAICFNVCVRHICALQKASCSSQLLRRDTNHRQISCTQVLALGDGSSSQAVFVSLFSVANCLGRLLAG
jgi:hypothetical protein